MTSEGSREIEAARKRLTAAKTQASAASKHKEMIAKLMVSANEMSNISNEEVKEAETMLKDAEKRWEVIDIEQEPDDSHKKNDSNKRRKVSVSPQTNNNNAQSVGGAKQRVMRLNDDISHCEEQLLILQKLKLLKERRRMLTVAGSNNSSSFLQN